MIAAVAMASVSAASAGVQSAAAVTSPPPLLSYVPSPDWWGTNGRVVDIKVVGGKVYIAGGFDYIGRTTGYGVGVNRADGALNPAQPRVDGIVRAAVSDGAGGWYIGGDFKKLDTRGRPGLAHVLADGSIDNGWNPKVAGGEVNALTLTPTGVVIGGTFSSIDGIPVNRLAKVNAINGELVPGWAGSASGAVRALASHDGRVYVGGDFTTLSGSTRSRLGRINETTGSLDTSFQGVTNSAVRALAVDSANGVVYAGGDFTSAAGGGSYTNRNRLAAFSHSAGTITSFAPQADGAVQALALDATGVLYAGGLFSTVGGASRARLAQISPSGAVGSLNASLNGCQVRHEKKDAHGFPACTPEVSSLAVSGGTLFVGGRFGKSGSVERHNAAAFSVDTGALTGWNPVAGDRPLALAANDASVYLGGEFTSVNGLVRRGLAALDASTGAGVATFRADADDYVEAMVASSDGSRLYVAGAFRNIAGKARDRMAAIDTATGMVVDGFAPKFNRNILALAYSSGAVYAGGTFTKVSRVARLHAVKLNATTGAVDTTWVANTFGPSGALRRDGMVMGLEATPDGSTVFLGGPFDTVNGTTVAGGIAVVSGSTGALGPRQLGGVAGCRDVGPWINRLYLSDDGKRLYGGDICPDYIYQWDAVNLSSPTKPTGLNWRNLCNGGMQGRIEVNGHFYYGTHGGDPGVGGRCQAYPGGPAVSQQRYFVFETYDGTLLPDAPDFNTPMGVWSFAATGAGLLVGGDFSFAGSARDVQQGLALFPGTP